MGWTGGGVLSWRNEEIPVGELTVISRVTVGNCKVEAILKPEILNSDEIPNWGKKFGRETWVLI